MEPFAIHCTTCQTRLVVRDASAIGQILACPRCASMVLVEAPAGHVGATPTSGKPTNRAGDLPASSKAADATKGSGAPGAAAPKSGPAPRGGGVAPTSEKQVVRSRHSRQHDSRADTLGDTFDDLDDLLANRPPATASVDGTAPRTAEAPPTGGSPQRESGDVATSMASANAPAAPAVDSPSEQDGDAANSPLTSVARWSPTTIVLAAGGVGIVLAVSAALLLIAGFGGQPATVASKSGSENGAGERAENDAGDSTESPDSASGTTDDSEGASSPGKPEGPASEKPANGASDSTKPTQEPKHGDGDAPPRGKTTTSDDGPAKPDATPNPKTEEGTKPPGKDGVGDYQPKPDEPRRPLEALGGKFAEFLNNAPLTSGQKPVVGEGPEPAEKEGGGTSEDGKPTEAPAERVALPRPLAREVDVEARLADSLASVAYQNVPLVDFVAELSEFSTIPITLDLRALALRRITVAAPVSVKLTGVKVEQVLAAALEPYQLVARPESDGQLVITIPSDAATREKRDHACEDLTGGDAAQLESLAALVTTFVVPDAWSGAGGDGTISTDEGRLSVEGPAALHLELNWFLDKLRVARRLKPLAKPPFPPSSLARDAVGTRAAEKLAATLKLNFGRPTRLTAILQRLGRDTGVRIVPNWQSLAAIGWTTETQATVTVEGKTLRETLATLLEPMELDYRVVDDSTIEVVAGRSARTMLDVEFHSLDGLPAEDPDTLMRRLENECGAERFAANGGTGVLRFDAGAQSVVAGAPYGLQRRIGEVLAGWRKDAAKKDE